MEAYATKEATAAVLVALGFTRFDDVWFDSPKTDEFGAPVVQCRIYQCRAGHWCVDVTGEISGFEAPIVRDDFSLFITWLDRHNPGWR